jgi:2-polyprenyl-3-methyl-5-hydroxy-6-metoxy-1,4-benzoquinol methylase
MTSQFKNYHSLDLQHKIYQIKAINLAKTLTLPPKPLILDLGCADASFIEYAANLLQADYLGLDINYESKKIKKFDLNSDKPFPFRDNTFDLIFTLEVIEHLFNTDHFLSEIYRILKPKGFLILTTPNLASLKNRFRLLTNLYPQYLEYSLEGAGHLHLYTTHTLSKQLIIHHLKPKTISSVNFPCPFITSPQFPTLLKNLAMFLGNLFPSLGSHIIALAQK